MLTQMYKFGLFYIFVYQFDIFLLYVKQNGILKIWSQISEIHLSNMDMVIFWH